MNGFQITDKDGTDGVCIHLCIVHNASWIGKEEMHSTSNGVLYNGMCLMSYFQSSNSKLQIPKKNKSFQFWKKSAENVA